MSFCIDSNVLSNETIEEINKKLIIRIPMNKFAKVTMMKDICAYHLDVDDKLYVPYSYGISELEGKKPKRKRSSEINIKFEGSLREEQKEVIEEAKGILTATGSVILSLYTGFGKTCSAIYLASTAIKLKTLIIVNKIVLLNQWEEAIMKFCPTAKIQKLKTSSVFDEECDFFIINAINIPKLSKDFFNSIQTVVVDELHLIMAETVVKGLRYLKPRYLIGLSATPYREDELDYLIELYFGENKIIREMKREHIVYIVHTGFSPVMTKTENGKLNWGNIIEQCCDNEERNEIILRIVEKFKDRNILILTKRITQGEYLYNRMLENDESVTKLLGSEQEFNKDARILIATVQKCSTGFDHPKLDTLILASDLESYFQQSLGRIFRRKDTIPICFDLVDNNFVMKKHFETRKDVYSDIGGKLKTLKI
jgi:superfamily II DNA or RNA helicase